MSQYHHKYFFHHIDRTTAEKYLQDQPNLTFLLREHYDSKRKESVAISIKKEDEVVHFQIPRDNDGRWEIPSRYQFSSLEKLVDYLQRNKIVGNGLLADSKDDECISQCMSHVNINANATRIDNLLIEPDMKVYSLFKDGNVFSIRYREEPIPLIIKVFEEQSLAKTELNNLLLLSCINDKVNVPRVLTHNIDLSSSIERPRSFSYLVMNRFPGLDLFEYVNTQPRGGISESLTRKVIKQLLTIVAHVHSCGVVHKDIKPENIIFDSKTESIALIDFEGRETKSYRSPEQVRHVGVGKHSDVWAIGVVCYSMLSRNETPFSNESAILYDQPNLNKTWSKKLRSFISTLLVKNRADRPTCEEALEHEWFHE